MNTYCAELNLDIHPFKDGLDPLTLPKIYHRKFDVKTFINPELDELLKSKKIYISFIEVFTQWRPFTLPFIHIDDKGSDDISKLNWVFGGNDSYHRWYKIKDKIPGKPFSTDLSTSALAFAESQVEEILHTHHRNPHPFIFQAGVPHSVTNGKEDRSCVSMIPRWMDTNKRLTFQEAVDALSDYLI